MKVETKDLVGPREIAELLGVGVDTVKRWRHRGIFIEPVAVVSGTHIWRWPEVKRWADKRGRNGRR